MEKPTIAVLEDLCVGYYMLITVTLIPLALIPALDSLMHHGKLLHTAAARSLAAPPLAKRRRASVLTDASTSSAGTSETDMADDAATAPSGLITPPKHEAPTAPVSRKASTSRKGISAMRSKSASSTEGSGWHAGLQKIMSHRVPKRWFSHFYVVAMIVTLSLWITTGPSWPLFLFGLHALRRHWEQKTFFDTSASFMHGAHYLLGISFYLATPLSIALAVIGHPNYTSPGFLLKCAFALSNLGQCAHHYFLSITPKPNSSSASSTSPLVSRPRTLSSGASAALTTGPHMLTPPSTPDPSRSTRRRSSIVSAGSVSSQPPYRLPRRGLFKSVTCPHYFFEILIYLCLLLMAPSRAFLACFVWVLANLTMSASQSHAYYQYHHRARKYRIFMYIY